MTSIPEAGGKPQAARTAASLLTVLPHSRPLMMATAFSRSTPILAAARRSCVRGNVPGEPIVRPGMLQSLNLISVRRNRGTGA